MDTVYTSYHSGRFYFHSDSSLIGLYTDDSTAFVKGSEKYFCVALEENTTNEVKTINIYNKEDELVGSVQLGPSGVDMYNFTKQIDTYAEEVSYKGGSITVFSNGPTIILNSNSLSWVRLFNCFKIEVPSTIDAKTYNVYFEGVANPLVINQEARPASEEGADLPRVTLSYTSTISKDTTEYIVRYTLTNATSISISSQSKCTATDLGNGQIKVTCSANAGYTKVNQYFYVTPINEEGVKGNKVKASIMQQADSVPTGSKVKIYYGTASSIPTSLAGLTEHEVTIPNEFTVAGGNNCIYMAFPDQYSLNKIISSQDSGEDVLINFSIFNSNTLGYKHFSNGYTMYYIYSTGSAIASSQTYKFNIIESGSYKYYYGTATSTSTIGTGTEGTILATNNITIQGDDIKVHFLKLPVSFHLKSLVWEDSMDVDLFAKGTLTYSKSSDNKYRIYRLVGQAFIVGPSKITFS